MGLHGAGLRWMRLEESQVGSPDLPPIPGVDSSLVDSLALSRLHPHIPNVESGSLGGRFRRL